MRAAKNFQRGPDRSPKISVTNPKSLRGASFGPAGKVKRINPSTIDKIDPPKAVSPAYQFHLDAQRRAGKPAIPYPKWLENHREKHRRRKKQAIPQALREHQQRPYKA